VTFKISPGTEYGQLSKENLEKFERGLNADLPEDYRDFLLKYNGGYLYPDAISFADDQLERTVVINCLYGLHQGPSYERLDLVQKKYQPVLPTNFLSIGDDPYDNQFLIYLKNLKKGQICYLDPERDSRPRFVAESFTDFLERLHN
jgi:hypothetical protein